MAEILKSKNFSRFLIENKHEIIAIINFEKLKNRKIATNFVGEWEGPFEQNRINK